MPLAPTDQAAPQDNDLLPIVETLYLQAPNRIQTAREEVSMLGSHQSTLLGKVDMGASFLVGAFLRNTRSGELTPDCIMATPDLAVPSAAPQSWYRKSRVELQVE